MATFGDMINLQPYLLNWLVNGENSDIAYRAIVSEKATGANKLKRTYEGRYQDLLDGYLVPGKYAEPTKYGIFNGTTSNVRFNPFNISKVQNASIYNFKIEVDLSADKADLAGDPQYVVSAINDAFDGILFITMSATGGSIGVTSSGGLYLSEDLTQTHIDLLTDGEKHTISFEVEDAVSENYPYTMKIDGNTIYTGSAFELGVKNGVQLIVGARTSAGVGGTPNLDFFKGNIYRVYAEVDGTVAIDCNDLSTGANAGTSGTGTVTDVELVELSVKPQADRKEYSQFLNKGAILRALVEYKKRWNSAINAEALTIDYVGFKGDLLVVKTTETAA